MPLAYQVAAGVDDAHEDDAVTFTVGAAALKVDASTVATSRFNTGLRFDNIAVAKDLKIQNAHLVVYVTSTGSDDARFTVSAHDVDDAANFSDTADVTGRLASKTTATAAIAEDSVGVGWYVIPGLTAIVQEIVNRALWLSGQAIVMLLEGESDAAKVFSIRSYEGTAAQAAKLTISAGADDPLDVVEAYRRRGVHARFAPML
jgi:hypothetical protein